MLNPNIYNIILQLIENDDEDDFSGNNDLFGENS